MDYDGPPIDTRRANVGRVVMFDCQEPHSKLIGTVSERGEGRQVTWIYPLE